jgi:hypothetical protein
MLLPRHALIGPLGSGNLGFAFGVHLLSCHFNKMLAEGPAAGSVRSRCAWSGSDGMIRTVYRRVQSETGFLHRCRSLAPSSIHLTGPAGCIGLSFPRLLAFG